MISSLIFYVLGVFTGFLTIFIYAMAISSKAQEARLKFAEELKKTFLEAEKRFSSVRDKMNRAQNITEEQLEIMYSMEAPQKGVLDGKNRKSLQTRLKALEQEKLEILESVIKEGHDPKITILNEFAERESLKLSEFLQRRKALEESLGEVTATEPERPKLTLIKNGEE